ncbi:hypothetical protein A7A08_02864 [Methyloligella halotolerans]|uniref:DUF1223 domain-containing protein n=1 Tax=Methyloligella halotolerans TaxID=1177755 RepID=A0A1E2RVF0_9HYPH|nr:DUF1223 domain-containing protein [Methyloligella halotolerans]ODA66217.1 hypothetical protein A7A08_02864 [Methyloligella halotolerans]
MKAILSKLLMPFLLGLAMLLSGLYIASVSAAPVKTPAVLELFTSQGCSSCPPADKLLGELDKRSDVIALSYSVDYWDYLGWKDTLGSPANSERQRRYAQARGDGRVYTPQIVVDGVAHAVGSNPQAVTEAIAAAQSELADRKVPIMLSRDGDALVASIGSGGDGRSATLWAGMAKTAQPVKIARGENRGRTVTYRNNVRQLVPVGTWSGEATRVTIPLSKLKGGGGDRVFVLLQRGAGGPILGAAELSKL